MDAATACTPLTMLSYNVIHRNTAGRSVETLLMHTTTSTRPCLVIGSIFCAHHKGILAKHATACRRVGSDYGPSAAKTASEGDGALTASAQLGNRQLTCASQIPSVTTRMKPRWVYTEELAKLHPWQASSGFTTSELRGTNLNGRFIFLGFKPCLSRLLHM